MTEPKRGIDLSSAVMAGADGPAPVAEETIGPEWQPCVKLPITVHVREQRPGETLISTREGITPVRPDDLIMRGVKGEEYPIGRELFNQTYRLGTAEQPAPVALEEESLMEAVTDAIVDVCGADYGCSRAAILAVADWLRAFPDDSGSCRFAASRLRREVGQ